MENKSIAAYIKQLTTETGLVETQMPGVRTYIADQYQPRQCFCYDPCLVIVGQGKKVVYLKEKEFIYDENNYLVLATVLPLECETFASAEKPLMNLIIDIDISILKEVIEKIKLDEKIVKTDEIIHTARINDQMQDAIIRLLKILKSKQEIDILGKDILKEIYYRALKDTPASALYTFVEQNTMLAKIAQTLNYINANIDRAIEVPELADLNNMSVSAFHKNFKNITGDSSPLQFIKKTRLAKAKSMLELQPLKANVVANKVGYESYSQFSREYKRMFGYSPKNTL